MVNNTKWVGGCNGYQCSPYLLLPRDPKFGVITEILPPIEPPDEAVLLLNGLPVVESSDPGEDDRLYKPVIDVGNNLTYIDICIVAKTQGGGH